ncbi:hypothetical protein HHI36_009826 [Cryptolaemus montrouzieri]|uniref:Uncharacterized protein n=1 Tax=Cryptolaemus montrouzieri TaxID=559131 RepID=A0ABD2MH24_9CUCU
MQKRKLIFYCASCANSDNSLTSLLNEIRELKLKNEEIKAEFDGSAESDNLNKTMDKHSKIIEVENSYLKKNLEEVTEKNDSLKQNNQLLLERICALQQRPSTAHAVNGMPPEKMNEGRIPSNKKQTISDVTMPSAQPSIVFQKPKDRAIRNLHVYSDTNEAVSKPLCYH